MEEQENTKTLKSSRAVSIPLYAKMLLLIVVLMCLLICLPQFIGIRKNIYNISCIDVRKQVKEAVNDYNAHNSDKPIKSGDIINLEFLKENEYLDEIILCPDNGKFIYNEQSGVLCTVHGIGEKVK